MKVKVARLTRPVKIDDVNLEQVEIIASLGMTDEEIAVILGISPRTLNYWKKRGPEFLQSLKRGKLKADFQIAKSLYEKAKAGDTTAMIFWLKNRQPERWRDRQQHDVSAEVKGEIKITVISAVPRPPKVPKK
jgi:predicted transcriptional regulator